MRTARASPRSRRRSATSANARRKAAKREASKYKIDRRLGVNLWGRPKSPYNKREYGPGQHGQRRKKPSEYGLQLAAKQRRTPPPNGIHG